MKEKHEIENQDESFEINPKMILYNLFYQQIFISFSVNFYKCEIKKIKNYRLQRFLLFLTFRKCFKTYEKKNNKS